MVAFWAGLHDLGKITPPFQAQVSELFAGLCSDPVYRFARGAMGEQVFRHEKATHWALVELFEEAGYPGDRRLLRRSVSHQTAQLLGGHHDAFGEVLKPGQLGCASAYQPGLGEEGWAAQRRVHFAELRRVTCAAAVPQRGLPAELSVGVGFGGGGGLVGQSGGGDYAVRRAGEGHLRILMCIGRGQWHLVSCVLPARLGRARFDTGAFEAMFPFAPNRLQRDLVENLPGLVAQRGPGLLLLAAPTAAESSWGVGRSTDGSHKRQKFESHTRHPWVGQPYEGLAQSWRRT